ncbi:MAG: GNAT family N-acetyltransferase [Ramlibacter sp.]|nr:GNAT family N-acetyltransferase [Cryobacterium sp.]
MTTELRPWGESDAGHLLRAFGASDDLAPQVGDADLSTLERHDTAWVYYWVSAEARGQGLATRSLASAARWAFEQRDLFRLELGHRVNNPASRIVALKAGFAPEGIERQKLKYEHQRYDVETHSRLRSDPAPEIELFTAR